MRSVKVSCFVKRLIDWEPAFEVEFFQVFLCGLRNYLPKLITIQNKQGNRSAKIRLIHLGAIHKIYNT